MSNDHLTDIAYRHFIESVKDYAIYMLSADGTVISWNEGARRAKGYLSDEIIGRYFGLFYSEAEQLSGVPAKNLEIALRSGQFEGEGWRYRKDGSRFWAHVMIDTIRDEQKPPCWVLPKLPATLVNRRRLTTASPGWRATMR